MSKNYFCIDVGGTYIKAGIVSDSGDVICSTKSKTEEFNDSSTLGKQIEKIIKNLELVSKIKISNSAGIAIGLPGLVDSKNGILMYSGNLNLTSYNLKAELEKSFSVPIKIANDADVATMAEQYYGAGVGCKNFIMVTVGTGIGGGIVIDGKALSSTRDYTGEIGHTKFANIDEPCTCGETGCSEVYASTKVLTSLTREAMAKHKDSLMWTKYNLETVNGKTVFEFKDIDAAAAEVFEEFIKRLGTILVNLSNILLPEMIVISGAISQQKNELIKPLETYVNSHIFARHINYKIKIKTAHHTKDAGIIGASCLFKEE